MPIRLLIAEDHTLVRSGIRALLERLPDVDVVAEAGDGHQTMTLVERHRPDVVLMDIAMPGLNGLEAAARLAKDYPETRVVVLSMHANEEYVAQALRVGAAGYLLKGADPAELELAVRAAARGETFLTPAVSRQVVDQYLGRTASDGPARRLTPRQREIVQLIAEGHTTKEIARRLALGVKTVETHRAQIMDRLDIHDVASLVRYAIREGLVLP